MAYHGEDRGIIHQVLRNADGDVGTAAVVHDTQCQLAAPDPAPGVDFLDRQLRGMTHGDAAGL